MSTERRAWLRDEMLRRAAAIQRARAAAELKNSVEPNPGNRDAMRNALLAAAEGSVSVHVVDAIIEQLVLIHGEQAAKIAKLRAELRAETAALRREMAAMERRVIAMVTGELSHRP